MRSQDISDEDLSGPVVDRRTALKLGGIAGLSAGLAGCTGDETNTGTEESTSNSGGAESANKSGGKIVAAWAQGELPNLDPVLSETFNQQQVTMNVFNSLVTTTSDLQIVPEIAKDWTVTDGTKYVFELREGVQFQAGYGELTAEDIKFSISRGKTADGSKRKAKLSPVKPVDEGGVIIQDKYTVEINLSEPFAPFIKVIARPGLAGFIQPKKAFDEMGKDKFRETFRNDPIGSGPFEITEHQVGERIVLQAHGEYWKTDDNDVQFPYLDEIEIRPLSEASTIISGLRSGEIDYTNLVPLQNLSEIKDASNVNAVTAPAGGWFGLRWNTNREPFSSKKARQGIVKLINREEFNEQAFFGNNEPAAGPIGPVQGDFYRPFDEKPDFQKYDPEEGERLVEESGMMGTSFSIIVPEGNVRQARVVKDMLDDYFDISINGTTYSSYRDATRNDDYDTTVSGSSIDLDIDTLFFFFLPRGDGGQYNFTGYSNPELTSLLKEQRKTADLDKRRELMHEIENIAMEDAARAFIYHRVPWRAVSERLNGYEPHAIQRNLAPVWVEE